MKHYLRFLAAAAAVCAVCILLLISAPGRIRTQGRDVVRLNDLVQTVNEHFTQPETLAARYPDTALLLFQPDGTLRWKSPEAPEDIRNMTDAVKRGCICMALHDGERFLGTVAVPDPVLTEYDSIQRRMLVTAAVILMVLLLLCAAGIYYIRQRIVLPFRRMRQFSEQIAQGRLDEPLHMEKANLFGSFTESFDIMREELRAARAREDALRLREKEIAAQLSHDIKTPVTGIKLICELLAVKTDGPYTRGKIAQINEKAEQIHVLAGDLLTVSLDEIGEMRVACTDMQSSELPALAAAHDPRGLIHAEPVPDCLISVDKGRLSQVLGNLISNSYKYADTPISIHYEFCGNHLRMDISDTGGGVPTEEIDLITSQYYRGKSNSGGKDGAGLGLYISGALMQRMGGQLICENRSGGLTVSLLLPLS